MRILCSLVVCLWATALPPGARGQDPTKFPRKIVGTWKPTRGEIPPGTTVEFTKGGKMRLHINLGGQPVNAEGTYRVDGNRITTTSKGPGRKQETRTARIKKLTASELVFEDAKGETMEFRRVK